MSSLFDEMMEESLEKDQKISDLEAKLAEKDDELLQKEKKIQDLMLCEFVATTLDFNKLSADNCRLREQLADIEANKEKEINRICKTHIEANAQLKQQLAYQEQKLQFVRKLDDATMLDILQKSNQDKISFAVEQLEKAKEWTHDNAYYVLGDFASVWEDALLDELDNQIKQLREMK